MIEIFSKLQTYFSYSFVQYALITGVLIAFCSSLLGVNLVLKRFSYIGDGLSHVAFGALSMATILKLTNTMFIVMPVTVVLAVVILCARENSKIKGDATIAMLSVGALAVGYLLRNIFAPPANLSGDVCSTLFGSTLILTLSKGEVILSIILSVCVILFYVLFYNKIFAVTFDQTFSSASGINVKVYNILMAVFVAVIIVLAMNLVGSLLISALIIFPAVSAMLLFKSFKSVTIFAAIFSVICAAAGIVTGILAGTPVGPTIVAVDIVGFSVCKIVSLIKMKL
jgi:zinc transport system permease protein